MIKTKNSSRGLAGLEKKKAMVHKYMRHGHNFNTFYGKN